jgi:hypothetical protein
MASAPLDATIAGQGIRHRRSPPHPERLNEILYAR